MAETNAKREARRRRILENSENRLRKITAKHNADEIKDDNPRMESNSLKAEIDLEEYNQNQTIIRNGTCNIGKEAELQDSTRFNDNEHENFLNDTSDKSTCLPEPSQTKSKPKFMLHRLLFNRINFILLAGIVNILVMFKLDNLFGQAIIIPYLLMMLGRLVNYKNLLETQDNNLLFTALILCNIKPKLIYKFKMSFAIFIIILNDFGLYMFSFVLMRYIITCYYHHNTNNISISV
ncbi:uncharacterized protein LOC114935667 [Nylanderia fulva]|uniref:uncharacterized protein LOC114935667 n=1 Tax=Nylanderia fulva TaxID=613905 RepID=UPI0010FBBBAD|nr:uncharacterized protein LOC114935667 [Nylanderia fulva]